MDEDISIYFPFFPSETHPFIERFCFWRTFVRSTPPGSSFKTVQTKVTVNPLALSPLNYSECCFLESVCVPKKSEAKYISLKKIHVALPHKFTFYKHGRRL